MLAQIFDHLAEIGAPGALDGFDVDIFLDDPEAGPRRVTAQQLALRGDGETLLLLFLGGHPRIKQRLDGPIRFEGSRNVLTNGILEASRHG